MLSIDGSNKWNWVDKLFKKTGHHYIFTSMFIGLLLFLLFVLFSFNVKIFDLHKITYMMEASVMCILITYELSGIEYLLRRIRRTFKWFQIETNIRGNCTPNDPYSILEHRLTTSRLYYAVISLVILPPLLLDISNHMNGNVDLFSNWNNSTWYSLLDLYNFSLVHFVNFLLGTIIWIIINLIFIFYEIGVDKYTPFMKISLISIDQMGGLSSLRNLIVKVIVYYFICIALAITSYFSPFGLIHYQNIFYASLISLGIILFIVGFWSIRGVLKGKVEKELNIINYLYECKYNKVKGLLSKEKRNEDELERLSKDLDLLYKCNEKLSKINWQIYDLNSILGIVGSIFISYVPLIMKNPELSGYAYSLLGNTSLNFK